MRKRFLTVFWLLPVLFFGTGCNRTMPAWQEGYLDIHCINTARGECTFYILPDGTTMLIDAGEIIDGIRQEGKPSLVDQVPDSQTRPYETYARYIRHFLPARAKGGIDYALASHFHQDHIGSVAESCPLDKEGGYYLTGMPGVNSLIPFRKVIDRIWPDYDSVRTEVTGKKAFLNWQTFVAFHDKKGIFAAERFRIGATDQFTLVHHPGKYPEFTVRNIAANGITSDGGKETNWYPQGMKRENPTSCCLLFSYGPFDWFTGGDASDPKIEIPVARAVGKKVEAMKTNHHLSWDTMDTLALEIYQPRVIVSQSYSDHRPDLPVLQDNILSDAAYSGPKSLYFTNMHPTVLEKMPSLEGIAAGLKGHIVIRVAPGGKSFCVYILEDRDFSYRILKKDGPFTCE